MVRNIVCMRVSIGMCGDDFVLHCGSNYDATGVAVRDILFLHATIFHQQNVHILKYTIFGVYN